MCFYNNIWKQFLKLCLNCTRFCHEISHMTVRKWLRKIIDQLSVSLHVQLFLNPVAESRDQRLQSFWFSDWMGTERKSSAFVNIQPFYKCCLWLLILKWESREHFGLGQDRGEERDNPYPSHHCLALCPCPCFCWELALFDSCSHLNLED